MTRVFDIVQFLKDAQHKNVIQYKDTWYEKQEKIVIITTCLDSLKDFALKKCSRLRWRIVKKWCRQILRGLEFLHTLHPVIVHRNLTCSHIYIDGGFGGIGAINIGDLWLSAQLVDSADPVQLSSDMVNYLARDNATSHIPPEVFAGQPLTPKADIYSFGMCVLEILTRDEKEPFKECLGDVNKIQRRVMRGEMPRVLSRITNHDALDFIRQCLSPIDARPTATELLQHSFISSADDDDGEIVLGDALSNDATTSEEFAASGEIESWSPNVSSSSVAVHTEIEGTNVVGLGHEDSYDGFVDTSGVRSDAVEVRRARSDSSENATTGRHRKLVDFETGENLYQDRGVHDGRREDDGKGELDNVEGVATSGASAAVDEQQDEEQQSEKSELTSYTFTVTATDEGPLVGCEFNVRTRMNYANGSITEVDFPFNTTTDDFVAVAQDFLTEFPLGMTVDELASTLRGKVSECAATLRQPSLDLDSVKRESSGQSLSASQNEDDLHLVDTADESTDHGGQILGGSVIGEFFDNATSMAASSLTLSENSSISSLEDAGNAALLTPNPFPHGEEMTFENPGAGADNSENDNGDDEDVMFGDVPPVPAVGNVAEEGMHHIPAMDSESGTGTDLGTGTIGERSSSLTHAAVVQNRVRAMRVQGDVGSADDITVSTAFSTVRFARPERVLESRSSAGGGGISALTVDEQAANSSSSDLESSRGQRHGEELIDNEREEILVEQHAEQVILNKERELGEEIAHSADIGEPPNIDSSDGLSQQEVQQEESEHERLKSQLRQELGDDKNVRKYLFSKTKMFKFLFYLLVPIEHNPRDTKARERE